MAAKSTSKKTSKRVSPAKTARATQPVARKKSPTKTAKSPIKTKKPVVAEAPVKRKTSPAAATKQETGKKKITFVYSAPQAASVLVVGDFTQWEASPIGLVQEQAGIWKTTVTLKPGKYQYRLLVDGQWQNDPGCPDLQPNEFGSANCVLSVAA